MYLTEEKLGAKLRIIFPNSKIESQLKLERKKRDYVITLHPSDGNTLSFLEDSEFLFKKAEEINVCIENIEIMPDHVHLFIKTKPNLAPQFVVAQFKGYTSHELRNEFSILRTRIPTLWTRSYYCESVGHISEKTVKKYIEGQKPDDFNL